MELTNSLFTLLKDVVHNAFNKYRYGLPYLN